MSIEWNAETQTNVGLVVAQSGSFQFCALVKAYFAQMEVVVVLAVLEEMLVIFSEGEVHKVC